MKPDEALALSNCDREPVHIPGRIQSTGALIAIDLKSYRVKFYSENIHDIFADAPPISPDEEFGGLFESEELRHAIRGSLGLPTIRTQRERIGVFEIAGIDTDVAIFVADETAVIELELSPKETGRPQAAVSTVRSMLSSLKVGKGVDTLVDSMVFALRTLTGFDRVMAYRFLANGDGEVVAEARGNGIEPYLGLRYPASDIPHPVRQIALRSPLRMINNIDDPHAKVITCDGSESLDMTLGHLRGVSPIHIEYLQNMGVQATMNTSIVVRGELWGLFAFHHYRKRQLKPDRRSICELFTQMAAMQIQVEEEQERMSKRRLARTAIVSLEDSQWETTDAFHHVAADLLKIISADGIAFLNPVEVACVGTTPGKTMIREICDLSSDEVFSLDCLASTSIKPDPNSPTTAGALVVRIQTDHCLVFFRNEMIQEVRWAGGKEKTIEHGPNGPRLTPRASFAEYKESVNDRCKAWSSSDISAVTEVRRAMAKLIHSSATELSRALDQQKKQQDLLIAELHHRVRNTLALVQSIARQTQSSSTSIDQYIESLEQRISALSVAHSMVGDSGMQWAKIGELIDVELKPYRNSKPNVTSDGPNIAIRADIAPIISLLFHEMLSNAVKHGALSDNGESLDVSWRHENDGIGICWREQLKTEVTAPSRRGFGFALIERAIPFQCDGKSQISFEGKCLTIEFWLPPDVVVASPEPEKISAVEKKPTETQSPTTEEESTKTSSACILEDNMVLAMEMEKLLYDLGFVELDTFPSIRTAETNIRERNYDIAVLDINLGEETSFGIAKELRRQGVPIIFVSGYDSKHTVPDDLAHIPRLTKPVDREQLSQLIAKIRGH